MSTDSVNISEIESEGVVEESGLLPEAPPRVIGEELSVQAARGAQRIEAQHREAEASGRALCALPNGEFGYLDEEQEFIGNHMYLSGRHSSLFQAAELLLEDPKPGHKYVWAAKYNPRGDRVNAMTVANIRSGRYRPVLTEELRGDCDLPIEEHKIAGFDKVAGIVDVVLCEISPEAQKMLYRWRVFEAKRKTNRWQSFQDLQDKVSAHSHGQAYVELEQKP